MLLQTQFFVVTHLTVLEHVLGHMCLVSVKQLCNAEKYINANMQSKFKENFCSQDNTS